MSNTQNNTPDDLIFGQTFNRLFDLIDQINDKQTRSKDKVNQSYERYKKLLCNNQKDIGQRRKDVDNAWNKIKNLFAKDPSADNWVTKVPVIIDMFSGHKKSVVNVKIYCSVFYERCIEIRRKVQTLIDEKLKYVDESSVEDFREQEEMTNAEMLTIEEMFRYRLLDLFRHVETDNTSRTLIESEMTSLAKTLDLSESHEAVNSQNPLGQMFSNVGQAFKQPISENAPKAPMDIGAALQSPQLQQALSGLLGGAGGGGLGDIFSKLMGGFAQPGQAGSSSGESQTAPDMNETFGQLSKLAQEGGLGSIISQMTSAMTQNMPPDMMGSMMQPPSAQPAIQSSAQPAIQSSAQPAVESSGQPAIQSSAQPAIQSSAQPAIQSSTSKNMTSVEINLD